MRYAPQSLPHSSLSTSLINAHSQPNGKPRSAGPKPATNGVSTRGARKAGRGGKGRGRPKRKTADELDAEMVDYFDAPGTNGVTAVDGTGAAGQGVTEEVMDEIS